METRNLLISEIPLISFLTNQLKAHIAMYELKPVVSQGSCPCNKTDARGCSQMRALKVTVKNDLLFHLLF